MYHPQFGNLDTGCICAGKLEGDIKKAEKREAELKNKEKRRETFLSVAVDIRTSFFTSSFPPLLR